MSEDRYLTTSLTAKEMSAIAGVVNVFYLRHPNSETAQNALAAYHEMCAQVDHDPGPGMNVAREALSWTGIKRDRRLLRWLGR